MPKGTDTRPPAPVKMLLLGDGGSGKTGALASLAKAGYKLVIADFDNGIEPLLKLLEGDTDSLSRLIWEVFSDRMTVSQGKVIPLGVPTAVSDLMNAMTRWRFGKEEAKYDLGPITSWGPDTIFVLDSLTFFGLSNLRYVQALLGNSGKHPHPGEYGEAMVRVENYLALLHGISLKCHVIVLTHILFQDDVEAESDNPTQESKDAFNKAKKKQRGVPMSLGDKLSPKVATYFNTCLRVKTQGRGRSMKRIIRTTTEGVVGLKFPRGKASFPDEVDISDGLAKIFKYLRGGVVPSN